MTIFDPTTFNVASTVVASLVATALLQVWFRRGRKALSQSQQRLSLTLRSAQIALWYWDVASDVVTADENCSAVFGLPLGQFPKTFDGIVGLVHPDDRARIRQDLRASAEHATDYNGEFRILWQDGTVRYLVSRANVGKNDGVKASQLTGVCWDVTERRKAEEDLRGANTDLQQSLGELEKHKQQNIFLSEMSDLLQSCSQSTEAYKIVAQLCAHLFPNCAGALYIFNSSRNMLRSVIAWNGPATGAETFDPDECWALRRGHPHVVVSGVFAIPCAHIKDTDIDGHICLPLVAQSIGLGILYLQNRPKSGVPMPGIFLNKEDLQVAITFAERVALSLSNLALQEALRLQSVRDALTGLFNRRYLEESFDRELHRMERRQQTAGLAMMDIDHFKKFNDTFGHEGGDALLRAFGQFLREHLRREDIACRYGGEEFCILFCEASLETTVRLAEQLRSAVKRLAVQHGGRHLGEITISIGVACYPAHGNTATELIATADSALYEAKNGGRDRVVGALLPDTTPLPGTAA
jgi:diguanylate cyclase (GGDEF)-like protein